jgi:hypothetical protein
MDDSEKTTLTATDTARNAPPSFQADQQCKTRAPHKTATSSSPRKRSPRSRREVFWSGTRSPRRSLDPTVRSIDYIASARVASQSVKLNAVVIVRNDGRYFLDVVESRPLRDIDHEGLAQIALRDLGVAPLTMPQV